MTTEVNDGVNDEPNENEEVIDLFAENADELLSDEQPAEEAAAVEGTEKDADKETVDDEPAIPEKFKGKSAAEIAASYEELEKEYGRRSNEVGELRKMTDEILRAQLTPKQDNASSETAGEVTSDDLLADPAGAVQKAVDNSPAVRELRESNRKAELQAELVKFQSDHEDAEQVMNSPQFQTWVNKNPVRAKRYAEANAGYDFAAASEIISTYKEVTSVVQETQKEERSEALKATASPAAGAANAGTTNKKYLLRSELMRLKIQDPARYERLQPQIIAAYREGRVK